MNKLYFKMCGNAFEEGYRIDKVTSGLIGLQDVFDGTFKALTGRTRITQKERRTYHLKATEFKEGSFLTLFSAAYSASQALPGIELVGSKAVWDLTKLSYDLLKELFRAAHAGKNPKIENRDNGTAIIYEGKVQNVYNGPVFNIATSTIKGFRGLDDVLEKGQVDRILIGEEDKKRIELNSSHKGLFRTPIVVDKEPQEVLCDLFDFNKYDKSGKVKVYPGQQIESGNYRFKIIGGQGIEDFILSMTAKKITVNCLVEYEQDPLAAHKIGSLLIMDVE